MPLAMSSPCPPCRSARRPGDRVRIERRIGVPAGSLPQIGVAMMPGCTEFTRMLSRARRTPAPSTWRTAAPRPWSRCSPPARPSRAARRPRTSSRSSRRPNAHRRDAVLDRQEHAIDIDRHLPPPVGQRHVDRRPMMPMPALATMMSQPRRTRSAAAITPGQPIRRSHHGADRHRRSVPRGVGRPHRPGRSAPASRPRATAPRAQAAPMPDAAPVTIPILPSSWPMFPPALPYQRIITPHQVEREGRSTNNAADRAQRPRSAARPATAGTRQRHRSP